MAGGASGGGWRACCGCRQCATLVALTGEAWVLREVPPRVLCGSGAGRRAALAPAPLSPGLAGGGGPSAEGGAAVRVAGGGSGSGPRVGRAWFGQLGLRRASGRSPPPLSGVRCAALGLARFGVAADERLAGEGWRTQAWPPELASPPKKSYPPISAPVKARGSSAAAILAQWAETECLPAPVVVLPLPLGSFVPVLSRAGRVGCPGPAVVTGQRT